MSIARLNFLCTSSCLHFVERQNQTWRRQFCPVLEYYFVHREMHLCVNRQLPQLQKTFDLQWISETICKTYSCFVNMLSSFVSLPLARATPRSSGSTRTYRRSSSSFVSPLLCMVGVFCAENHQPLQIITDLVLLVLGFLSQEIEDWLSKRCLAAFFSGFTSAGYNYVQLAPYRTALKTRALQKLTMSKFNNTHTHTHTHQNMTCVHFKMSQVARFNTCLLIKHAKYWIYSDAEVQEYYYSPLKMW